MNLHDQLILTINAKELAGTADPKRCAVDRELIEIAYEHAAQIDGEWGCCHDVEEIRNRQCVQFDPPELPIIVALAKAYGLEVA